MADSHLSLSWDDHQKNICTGLGILQQRGEFVDMTLAADGHYVKVHQMVMCLVSPYIKDLVNSAPCPHPVIFLNNISYPVLCSILEYIYTGHVLISKELLPQLVDAGKALFIKGLKEMDATQSEETIDPISETKDPISETNTTPIKPTLLDKLRDIKEKKHNVKIKEEREPICKVFIDVDAASIDEDQMETEEVPIPVETPTRITNVNANNEKVIESTINKAAFKNPQQIQYSVSNQGTLQLIVNRYIYTLKYVQKKLLRFWRCVDSSHKNCPANIYTNEKNEIVKRTFAHNHPFHDEKILKKLRRGAVYVAYNEATTAAQYKKTEVVAKKEQEINRCSSQSNDSE